MSKDSTPRTLRVAYDSGQMKCCGHPFAVGDQVTWTVEGPDDPDRDDAWLETLLGPEIAGRIDHQETHCDVDRLRLPMVRGTVADIQVLYCRSTAEGHDPVIHAPIPGSGTLGPAERATGLEDVAPGTHHLGWIVTLHDAVELEPMTRAVWVQGWVESIRSLRERQDSPEALANALILTQARTRWWKRITPRVCNLDADLWLVIAPDQSANGPCVRVHRRDGTSEVSHSADGATISRTQAAPGEVDGVLEEALEALAGSSSACRRCGEPVIASAEWFQSVFEKMHYVCFHYEFEHFGHDPDEECDAGGCPSANFGSSPSSGSD